MGGGRSARYDEGRRARGSQKQYAAEWSDASAAVMLQQLQELCGALGDSMLSGTLRVLQCDELGKRLLQGLRGKLSPHDETVAAGVLELHQGRVRAAGAEDKVLKALTMSFLKPLRERASARTRPSELKVTVVSATIRRRLTSIRNLRSTASALARSEDAGWRKKRSVVPIPGLK